MVASRKSKLEFLLNLPLLREGSAESKELLRRREREERELPG
jgi:hypothetical protein